MKKFIISILALLGIRFSPKAIEKGKTQTWYGRVNKWRKSNSLLKDEIAACAEYGVDGYMIEMASWAGDSDWSENGIKKIEKDYKNLVSLCRAAGIWLFVSIVNDNMGKGKYGDTGPNLNAVYPLAQKLVKIIKENGKQNVVIQPVAETQTNAGIAFEKYCIQELGGFQLVYNGNGGQPTGILGGMKFRAYHPSSVSKTVPSDALAISDHGLIIRELAIDGGLASKGNPSKVTTWKNNVKKWGCPVCGYYAFLYDGFDKETIKALGK